VFPQQNVLLAARQQKAIHQRSARRDTGCVTLIQNASDSIRQDRRRFFYIRKFLSKS